jgi:hypothetical protein
MNATVEGTVPLKASPSFSNTHMSTEYFQARRPPHQGIGLVGTLKVKVESGEVDVSSLKMASRDHMTSLNFPFSPLRILPRFQL